MDIQQIVLIVALTPLFIYLVVSVDKLINKLFYKATKRKIRGVWSVLLIREISKQIDKLFKKAFKI